MRPGSVPSSSHHETGRRPWIARPAPTAATPMAPAITANPLRAVGPGPEVERELSVPGDYP